MDENMIQGKIYRYRFNTNMSREIANLSWAMMMQGEYVPGLKDRPEWEELIKNLGELSHQVMVLNDDLNKIETVIETLKGFN